MFTFQAQNKLSSKELLNAVQLWCISNYKHRRSPVWTLECTERSVNSRQVREEKESKSRDKQVNRQNETDTLKTSRVLEVKGHGLLLTPKGLQTLSLIPMTEKTALTASTQPSRLTVRHSDSQVLTASPRGPTINDWQPLRKCVFGSWSLLRWREEGLSV